MAVRLRVPMTATKTRDLATRVRRGCHESVYIPQTSIGEPFTDSLRWKTLSFHGR